MKLTTRLMTLATTLAVSGTVLAGGAQGVDEGALVRAELDALQAATLHLQRLDNAINEGWSTDISGCVEMPGVGGMGHHWADLARFDGEVSLLEPEVLVFEPMPDGSRRLVALEYIVPVAAWAGGDETAPRLFGRDFHVLEAIDSWILHVWLYRNNPAGMFEDFNPNVNCDHAE